MKKSVQNDFDLEMINLDETAGWSQLEVESALNEQTVATDNVFRGEITYEDDYSKFKKKWTIVICISILFYLFGSLVAYLVYTLHFKPNLNPK